MDFIEANSFFTDQMILGKLISLKESKDMTWEQVAKALYQILDNIDTSDDMCKESSEAFRNVVMKIQAKKNELLNEQLSYKGGWIHPDGDIEYFESYSSTGHWEEFRDRVNKLEEGLGKTLVTTAAASLIGLGGMQTSVPKDKSEPPTISAPSRQEVTPKFTIVSPKASPQINISKIASIESSNNPKAENKRSGARGLLQITKPTWEEMTRKMNVQWSWEEAFDSNKNRKVGSYYLNIEIPRLLKHYNLEDNLENRLAAYNWGVGNLKGNNGVGGSKLPEETKSYIAKYKKMGESIQEAFLPLGKVQTKLKNYYKGKSQKLVPCTYSGKERGELKFWLLTDGTVIPVFYAYLVTINKIDIAPSDMYFAGAIAGYFSPHAKEIGITGGNNKPTQKQIESFLRLYKEYGSGIEKMFLDLDREDFDSSSPISIKNIDQLEYILTYGYGKKEAEAWESINESLTDFAKKELQLAGLFDKDSDYDGMIGEAVMDLIQKFADQGHSGFSAGLTTSIFNKLAEYKPLTELTDNPEEWMDVNDARSPDHKPDWQSKRCPTCFSTDEGKTYYDLDELGNAGFDKRVMHKSKITKAVEARGYWRDWTELVCTSKECPWRSYRKTVKETKPEVLKTMTCPKCGSKLEIRESKETKKVKEELFEYIIGEETQEDKREYKTRRLDITITDKKVRIFFDGRLNKETKTWLDISDDLVVEATLDINSKDKLVYLTRLDARIKGSGYGPELLEFGIKYAIEKYGVTKARGYVESFNIASQSMLEKMGFKRAEETKDGAYWEKSLGR